MKRIYQTMQTLDFDVELLTFFQRGKRPTEYKIATRHVFLQQYSNLLMHTARNLRETRVIIQVDSHPVLPGNNLRLIFMGMKKKIILNFYIENLCF